MVKAARTGKDLKHHNTVRLRRLKVVLQRYPGTHGSDADRCIADVDWALKVDGRLIAKGRTGSDGVVEAMVPAGSRTILEAMDTEYEVVIAPELKDVTDRAGQQRRLTELGYWLGEVDGTLGRRTDRSILEFQADTGLDPDGVVGSQTRSRLTSEGGPEWSSGWRSTSSAGWSRCGSSAPGGATPAPPAPTWTTAATARLSTARWWGSSRGARCRSGWSAC